ncbi:hypothetical protein EB796_016946 [Bugula neritina]|uniref:Uncharacterized protein n=1 Tax=Bugula neritina TaxID=10212 RepID=A0A7J7JGI1_BUGNE|nr:hypothetical protein EB796_016946 [Bugula neritina]
MKDPITQEDIQFYPFKYKCVKYTMSFFTSIYFTTAYKKDINYVMTTSRDVTSYGVKLQLTLKDCSSSMRSPSML